MKITRILIADDHPIVRKGLRDLVEAEEGLEVVGEAADGLAVGAVLEETKADVLLLDLMMPGLGGLEVLRQVRRASPGTRVVVFSMHQNEAYVIEALQSGASGYVLKDSSSADVLAAIQAVMAGSRYLSSPLSERAIEVFLEQAGEAPENPYQGLTSREKQVLHLAGEGKSARAIAEWLSISPRTAETHRTNLMRKLGLHSQNDLVRFCLERDIISSKGR